MNVLLLSPWFPWPPFGGALMRVFETIRHLSERHHVTLVAPVGCPPEHDHLKQLARFCAAVVPVHVSEVPTAVLGRMARGLIRGMPLIQGLHYDRTLIRQLDRLTAANGYDVIHVEHSFMAPYVAAIQAKSSAVKVLSLHNVESLRFRREMAVAPWGPRRLALSGDHFLFGSWEQRAVAQFDAIAAVSPAEQEWAGTHAPAAEVAVVPNGVNVDYFRPPAATTNDGSVVFPGLMNYPPNIDAVKWFCKTVLPLIERRRSVRFSIVGDKPPASVRRLARSNVQVTGRVADVRPHLGRAGAVVVPVRSGAGTRLKILEAMAMQRPVISTAQGAEGLDVTNGVNILIADTPAQFADHVCAVLSNPHLGERLGHAGRRLVELRYDWRLCFRHLDALYDAVIRRGGGRPAPVQEAVR